MAEKFRGPLHELFRNAQQRHRKLALSGEDSINLTEDDIVTAVDLEMTDLIVNHFRENLDYDFSFLSEELYKGDNPLELEDADYTVIFDEIDGTAKMRRDTGSFGPVIAIAEGTNPRFNDIMVGAFLDLQRGEFYESYRGNGSYFTSPFPGTSENIESSKRKEIDGQYLMGLLIDQSMLGKASDISANAWKYPCNDFGVQARHFSWIADGTWDAFITGGYSYLPEKPVNTGEELAGMYRLIQEAGGAIVDWNGNEIGPRKIGLSSGKNHDIIATATEELGKEIAEVIIPADYQQDGR